MKTILIVLGILGSARYAEAQTDFSRVPLSNSRFRVAGNYSVSWYKPAFVLHVSCWIFSNNQALKPTDNKSCYGTGEEIGWFKERFATSYICARYIQFNSDPGSLFSIESLPDEVCMNKTSHAN